VRLLSWLSDGTWSPTHISHIGEPLCASPMPEKPQARRERPAEIKDLPHICVRCRELAVKAATGQPPLDETCGQCGYYKRGIDGTCVDCGADWPLQTPPASFHLLH